MSLAVASVGQEPTIPGSSLAEVMGVDFYHTGCLPQMWYSPNLQVEQMFNNSITQLICTRLQAPRADAIRTCSLSYLGVPELISHLKCPEGQSRAGGVNWGSWVDVGGVEVVAMS